MIYVWKSKALANYASGTLAAIGTTLEGAKEEVRKAFKGWIAFEKHWLDPSDPCDKAELDALWEKLEQDLAKEPTLTRALAINGSE